MDNLMVGFIFLLIVVLISKLLSDVALKKLDTEKKAQLIDLFSKRRTYVMIINIALIGLFFGALKMYPEYYPITLGAFIAFVLVLLVVNIIGSQRILKKNDFPLYYIKNYILCSSIRIFGFMVYFIITLY